MYTMLDRKMAEIYASRIEKEQITLADVPIKIRDLVAQIISSN